MTLWLWVGGGIVLLGSGVAAWPGRGGRRRGGTHRPERRPEPSPVAHEPAPAGAVIEDAPVLRFGEASP
jgi:hypothetical protein